MRSIDNGIPIHAASSSFAKSTSPIKAARIYDAMTPRRIGTIFIIPFPQMEEPITTVMATMERSQFCEQLLMAEPESVRPIAITIGPVTIGGKKRITFSVPNIFRRNAMMKYIMAAVATPMQA